MKTALVYHEKYLEHNLGPGHPETPERLSRTMIVLNKILKKPEIVQMRPEPGTEDDILRVHTKNHFFSIKSKSYVGDVLTSDTPVPRGTYDLACLSAGGAILAGKAVCEKQADNAFALIRPPGHHAGRNFGGGFCFFNNMAIMIEHLRANYGLKKFAILDWDVHHGNGTQDIYYQDPSVLYFSTHQSPLYPGTGTFEEIGDGPGKGYKINFPLMSETSGASFEYILEEIFVPVTEAFKPDIICISAGYDAYFRDPIANLSFTIKTYANATELVKKLAEKVCDGRVVVVLEGGYDLDALPQGILATVSKLAGLDNIKEPYPPPKQELSDYVREKVSLVKRNLSPYWNVF
jgi:acetoin utilization deacetylase AcuC-like enzyme